MTKLICFDMDGMIFEHSNFWLELHKEFDTLEEGKVLTETYLYTNYETLVKEVIGRLWKNKPAEKFYELIKKQNYMPGVVQTITTLKEKGFKIAIISSGSKTLAERAQKELGIDFIYTNTLEIKDGKVTGSIDMDNWPIRAGNKAEALRELCTIHNIDLKDVIVVVHDTNDVKMAKTAGFAIAFNPINEEILKYCNSVISGKDIQDILPEIESFENR
ncbi:MAG: HAD family phosphatase [Nanoarchaeota archaeon]|nr:HAD family phosphatase [Nanoarchaeota archaeon]